VAVLPARGDGCRDGIVSQVWSQAAPAGQDGINAVDRAFPMDENFDDFTVRTGT